MLPPHWLYWKNKVWEKSQSKKARKKARKQERKKEWIGSSYHCLKDIMLRLLIKSSMSCPSNDAAFFISSSFDTSWPFRLSHCCRLYDPNSIVTTPALRVTANYNLWNVFEFLINWQQLRLHVWDKGWVLKGDNFAQLKYCTHVG